MRPPLTRVAAVDGVLRAAYVAPRHQHGPRIGGRHRQRAHRQDVRRDGGAASQVQPHDLLPAGVQRRRLDAQLGLGKRVGRRGGAGWEPGTARGPRAHAGPQKGVEPRPRCALCRGQARGRQPPGSPGCSCAGRPVHRRPAAAPWQESWPTGGAPPHRSSAPTGSRARTRAAWRLQHSGSTQASSALAASPALAASHGAYLQQGAHARPARHLSPGLCCGPVSQAPLRTNCLRRQTQTAKLEPPAALRRAAPSSRLLFCTTHSSSCSIISLGSWSGVHCRQGRRARRQRRRGSALSFCRQAAASSVFVVWTQRCGAGPAGGGESGKKERKKGFWASR